MPTIEKIEKIEKTVEVHQLQFSFQVVDVPLSRNDELGGFHSDPVHRQKRYCPVLRGQVLMIQLCKKTVEFPMAQNIQGLGRVTRATAVSRLQVPNTQTVQKSLKVLSEFKLVSAKGAKEIIQFLNVSIVRHVEKWAQAAFPAEIDEHLAKRYATSKKPSSTTCHSRCGGHVRETTGVQLTVQQYQGSTDQRVETGDVSMAREVTSVKTNSHRSEFE